MMTLAHEVNVSLSVVVTRQDDASMSFSVWPLLPLTALLMLLWNIGLLVNKTIFTLAMLRADVTEFLDLTGKLLSIGINSLAWGVVPYAIRT